MSIAGKEDQDRNSGLDSTSCRTGLMPLLHCCGIMTIGLSNQQIPALPLSMLYDTQHRRILGPKRRIFPFLRLFPQEWLEMTIWKG